ncbi:hypothetical protein BGZ51_005819 [Haplosporangium sp. Z 767]|nr:hypothetical protein BGZ51_005819 [Haplosporangium sp. Z 767]
MQSQQAVLQHVLQHLPPHLQQQMHQLIRQQHLPPHMLPAPIPEPSTSSQPNPKRKGKLAGKKSHAYTPEHETFIAQQVADPDIWELLYGPSDANAFNKPKTGIRNIIVNKFNNKFTTEGTVAGIDEAQLKNKLRTMMTCWKTANSLFKKTGNGNLPRSDLMTRVLNICHYYKVWAPFASTSLNLTPRDPVQLTGNLPRTDGDNLDDDGESNDEDDTVVQLDADDEARPQRSRVPSFKPEQPPKELARPPKKSKGSATDIMELIEDLKDKAAEEREIVKQDKAEQQENSRMTLEYRR